MWSMLFIRGLATFRILMMPPMCRILLITSGNKFQKPKLFCFARLNYAFGVPGTLKKRIGPDSRLRGLFGQTGCVNNCFICWR